MRIVRFHTSLPLALILGATTSLLGVRAVTGQSLTGLVVVSETGTPLEGVFVTLRDADGGRIAGDFSRRGGEFRLSAPAAGRYLIRAELIGYQTVEAAVDIQAGEPTREIIRLPLQAIDLGGLVARAPARRQCSLEVGEGDALSRLWEEARKGLEVAEWSREAGWLRADGYTYERLLDLADLQVREERVTPVRSLSHRTFTAGEPGVVLTEGFIRSVADGALLYEGADASLLLSEEFLQAHCFSIRQASDGREVGIGFEPESEARRRPGISGVLWLDAETAQPLRLEYRYTGHLLDFPVPLQPFGGRTEFRALPGGGITVERWWIRMPVLEPWAGESGIPSFRRCGMAPCDDPATLRRLRRAGLGIKETGGAVMEMRLRDGTRLPTADRAAVAGVVQDSTMEGGGVLAGAEISIIGTEHRAVTDQRGAFRLENLAEGVYALTFRHPRLDVLGIERLAPVQVQAAAGRIARATLAVPSPGTLARIRCGHGSGGSVEGPLEEVPAREASAGAAVVYGMVREASSRAGLPGAKVRLLPGDGGGVLAQSETDADGRFLLCSVAPGEAVVAASFLGAGEVQAAVSPEAGSATAVDLDLMLSAPGRLTGRVVADGGASAVAGAAVIIHGTGRRATTDARGRFAFESVPAGPVTLGVEHVAHAPASGTVQVGSGEVVEVELHMAEQVFDLEPIVVTARSNPLLWPQRLGGFHTRRARGLGTFLEPEDLEHRQQAKLTEVLREVPGLRVLSSGGTMIITSGRRAPSLSTGMLRPGVQNTHCVPMVYIDGVRITNRIRKLEDVEEAFRDINAIPVSQIAGIEVYAGPASVPGRFAGLDTSCGVIAVWTKALDPDLN